MSLNSTRDNKYEDTHWNHKKVFFSIVGIATNSQYQVDNSQASIYINDHGQVEIGTPHINTFGVMVDHKVLPGINAGVRFHVETVPDVLPQYKEKPAMKREEYLNVILLVH